MKGLTTSYLISFLLIIFSFYQFYLKEYVEFAMYLSAGIGFITTGLIKNERLTRHRRWLTILSWVSIFTAGFLLMFLFRTDQ